MSPANPLHVHTQAHPHHHPGHVQDPDDFEPNLLPVDPDQGPVPAAIPIDPEHDRMVDPEV